MSYAEEQLIHAQQQTIARLRTLLERARIGAWHEAWGGHEDPDPTWHCCDWRGLAQDIDAELGGEHRDPSAAAGVSGHP